MLKTGAFEEKLFVDTTRTVRIRLDVVGLLGMVVGTLSQWEDAPDRCESGGDNHL